MDLPPQEQVTIDVDDPEILYGSDSDDELSTLNFYLRFRDVEGGGGAVRLEDFEGAGGEQVEEGGDLHEELRNLFVAGMGVLSNETEVVAVHKITLPGISGNARVQLFQLMSGATAMQRGGDGNLVTAFYGASRAEICGILRHGFCGTCGDHKANNAQSYGCGVHLSTARYSIDQVLSSAPDENGWRHMLVCKVIMGNMEVIKLGSKQQVPTSSDFDSGVDNLAAPRKYTVWTPYMNSHILPTYIVSFKTNVPRHRVTKVGC